MAISQRMALKTCLVIVLVAASGCSVTTRIRLFNNSGGPVTLQLERSSGWREGQLKYVTVSAGRSVKAVRGMLGPVMTLRGDGCEYAYDLATVARGVPSRETYGAVIPVQVEPDFSVYLLPPQARGIRAASELDAVQRPGFPARPVSETCP